MPDKKYRLTRPERYAGGAGVTGRMEETVIAVPEDAPGYLTAGAEQLADDAEPFDWRPVADAQPAQAAPSAAPAPAPVETVKED